MKIYQTDITVAATVYIKATDEADAKRKLETLANTGFEVTPDRGDGAFISGKMFDDPDLPEISLSPAMSIGDDFSDCELEEAE